MSICQYIYIGSLLLLMPCCSHQNCILYSPMSRTDENYARFLKNIQSIDSSIFGELTYATEVMGSEEFVNLLSKVDSNIPFTITLLSDPNVTFQQSFIACCSVQRVNDRDYLCWLQSATELYLSNRMVHPQVMEFILSPTSDWSTFLSENAKDAIVQEMLKKLQSDAKNTPQLNEILDYYLYPEKHKKQ